MRGSVLEGGRRCAPLCRPGAGRRSAFPGPAALCAGQRYALLARLWRAVPTGGRRSKPSPPPRSFAALGAAVRSEGPHRENWPAFPPRPRSPQISAIPSSRPREPREGVRYARSARSTRPAPRGDKRSERAAGSVPAANSGRTPGRCVPDPAILEESDAVEHPPESPFAGSHRTLFRVPEPQFFQVANGRLRKANETFRHGFTRCRVVSWPRQATGRVRPPDRQAPRRPLA